MLEYPLFFIISTICFRLYMYFHLTMYSPITERQEEEEAQGQEAQEQPGSARCSEAKQ